MARNEEKSKSMLHRHLAQQSREHNAAQGNSSKRRPFLAQQCDSLPEAEKWRHQVLAEIARFVLQIQDASLGEVRIRDMNEKINKLIREKRHWERRILELGGPNYRSQRSQQEASKAVDTDLGIDSSTIFDGGNGYYYFGAAKDLPEIKEHLTKAAMRKATGTEDATIAQKQSNFLKHLAEVSERITPSYYGYADRVNEELLAAEARKEQELLQGVARDESHEPLSALDMAILHGHPLPVPTAADIEQILLQRKKEEVMRKYRQRGS
jgi:pre-mRNA-splicing factor ISY1